MDYLTAGVIGVGSMGKNHARIYSEALPGIKLIGVADKHEATARSVAKAYGCPAYTDYRELLAQGPDLISIAVPTTNHFEVASEAIRAKINILVEKPVTRTLEEADQLIDLAQQNNVKAMVGHVERFNPAVEKLKQLLREGLLGEIISISTKRVGPYNPRIRDVGIILDLGAHDIDVMSYLYGDPVRSVYGVAGKVFHEYEDYAILTLRFNNGSSGVIETNWLTPHRMRKLTLVGSKGIAELDYQETNLRLYDKNWTREAKIDKVEPLKLELEHFVNCIRFNLQPMVDLKQGKHALSVALKAIESARLRKVCDI